MTMRHMPSIDPATFHRPGIDTHISACLASSQIMTHHQLNYPHLCSSNSLPRPLAPLPTAQMALLPLDRLATLLHDLLALRQNQLHVARLAHVRVDATVGTVGAATLLGCLVHLDVLDDEVGGVEAFGVGVGLGVLEEIENVFGGLFGPARFVGAEGLAWRGVRERVVRGWCG